MIKTSTKQKGNQMDIAHEINQARNSTEVAEYCIGEIFDYVMANHYNDDGDPLYSVETQRCDDLIEEASVLIAKVNNLLEDAATLHRKATSPIGS